MSTQLELAVGGALTGLSDWAVGTNVFAGPVRPAGVGIPERAVFCMSLPGAPYEDHIGDGTHIAIYHIQLRYRGHTAYATALDEAQAIFDRLHNLPVDTYLGGYSIMGSGPLYLGEDNKGRNEFSMTYEYKRKEVH